MHPIGCAKSIYLTAHPLAIQHRPREGSRADRAAGQQWDIHHNIVFTCVDAEAGITDNVSIGAALAPMPDQGGGNRLGPNPLQEIQMIKHFFFRKPPFRPLPARSTLIDVAFDLLARQPAYQRKKAVRV